MYISSINEGNIKKIVHAVRPLHFLSGHSNAKNSSRPLNKYISKIEAFKPLKLQVS